MTIVHITGARPNFPKAAPVIESLEQRGVPQQLIHTGQHYDDRLSEVFFRDLGLPQPDVNLGVGSGSHAVQTAAIMVRLEETFLETRPRIVVVYGDVNSTLAASLVCAKLQIPVAHVEAGLRSFDMTMPEEVNRRVTDQLADLLFVTSPEAIGHLAREGVPDDRIHFVGNPMIDTLMKHLDRLDPDRYRPLHGLDDDYVVATLHRPSNVDSGRVVDDLVASLHAAADLFDLVIPLHPRGRKQLMERGLGDHERIKVIEPVGYVEFVSLVRGADAVVTDSGGVQEETTVLGVPCLTLRANTERPVTITHGTNQLVTVSTLVEKLRSVKTRRGATDWPVPPLWDGHAGERIGAVLERWVASV
jgi:UDP-N-acetylglucosamine 2-epimerase (non-hydrolysing)